MIVVFHGGTDECDEVFGRVAVDEDPLTRLGSLGDYRGNITPIVGESDFVFDLTADSGPRTLRDEGLLEHALRRLRPVASSHGDR